MSNDFVEDINPTNHIYWDVFTGDRWHISSTLVVPGNWSHRVGPRKLGSTWRLGRLIKCREAGGDPKSLGLKVME